MDTKNNKSFSVIKSASIVIIVTLITKVLGFVREICLGSIFGTSTESDIYFWAMSMTTVIFVAIATAISSAMLPALNEFRLDNKKDKLKKYINRVFTFTALASFVLMLIYIFSSPYVVKLIARNYTGEDLMLAIKLVRILSISIIFIVIAYVAKTILQANEKFFIYSFISFPYNIAIILYLLFFADKYGIVGLAYMTVCGWLCQFLVQIPSLRKLNVSYKLDFNFKDEELKKFMILIMPLLISTLIYSVNTFIDKSIALNLSDGKVAGLNYGYNMYLSIITTIILGISTVLYPKFIESKVLNSKEEFKNEIIEVLKIMTYISLPILICFIVLNKQLVEIAYMRNSFDAMSVELTRYSLIYYALGTVSYTFQEILMKIFYSMKESKIPMITSIISVIINVVLNFILVAYMDYKGLALATTIAITFNAIMLFAILEKKLGSLTKRKLLVTFIKSALSLVLSVLTANFMISKLYVTGANILVNIAALIITVGVAGILYLASSYILGMNETKFIFNNFFNIKKLKLKSKSNK